ncbi:MAG: hypothetical protein KJ795_10490 [Gammaproteobacteria bacterium]|nr:hypothetical protein [Gammaproteobacteria bacterium]MBU1968200.1 hypothetical protein [Gammaproteobacteria bacterium]
MQFIFSNRVRTVLLLCAHFVLLCSFAAPAAAELLDDVSMSSDTNGGADAVVRFSVPIQYLRHFPQRKSLSLSIYFNVLGDTPREQWQNYEAFRSPPSDAVTRFTVTTRDLSTGPKIVVHFTRPAEYIVTPGKDGRSILIHIKADKAQRKDEPEARLPVEKPVVAVAAVPPVMTPPPAILPPKAVPPVESVVPIAPPIATAPPPVAASAKSKPAPAPQVVVPKQTAQLGGMDGLPRFPKIDPYTLPVEGKVLPEAATVEQQTLRSNNQAAPLMVAGRDALLAGQMFAAIEAFNKVLNLPPNKYSPDAQLWIGIARERSGQQVKARTEYELYQKLYPEGEQSDWIKARLRRFGPVATAKPKPEATKPPPTEFQTTQYGSVSSYYYHGNSQTDTVTTTGTVETPVTLSTTDQSSLIANVNMTVRSYNNEYDNRLVFQDLYSANFLPGKDNTNRMNAAYYELRNRFDNYSTRIGRQSALGGGVMGRFDGISGGYGFLQNWRVNAAVGRLSEYTLDTKPTFYSLGLDFGLASPLGGSFYYISQNADGLLDRKATGGNLRYFEQGMSANAMLDYDMQFKEVNFLTLQGTLNSEDGIDYNFLLDRRRAPTWSIRNAVIGTTSTVEYLLQHGWTMEDLIALAKLRTAISNMAQIGMTQRLSEKWQLGTDFVVSNTTGLPASGTKTEGGTIGDEGYVDATPSTGTLWSISERVSGTNVISSNDISTASLSYSRSNTQSGTSLMFNSRVFLEELWTVDGTLRLYWQKDDQGGSQNTVSPLLRVGYRWRNDITLEGEGGMDWIKTETSGVQPTKTTRTYFSFGFRWDY